MFVSPWVRIQLSRATIKRLAMRGDAGRVVDRDWSASDMVSSAARPSSDLHAAALQPQVRVISLVLHDGARNLRPFFFHRR